MRNTPKRMNSRGFICLLPQSDLAMTARILPRSRIETTIYIAIAQILHAVSMGAVESAVESEESGAAADQEWAAWAAGLDPG